MANLKEMYDQFIILRANMDRIFDHVSQMEDRVSKLELRMVRLESSAEANVERAKNEALKQTVEMMLKATAEIQTIKSAVTQLTAMDQDKAIGSLQSHITQIAASD